MRRAVFALALYFLATAAVAGNFPKRYYINGAAGSPVLPTCNASTSKDGRIYTVLDPVDASDCTTGNSSGVPHLCVCDGSTSTWVPAPAPPSDVTVVGQIELVDEQGTGGNDVTFAVTSTAEQMYWFDAATVSGGVTSRLNGDCVGSTDPHACCTGSGTGTCGDLTLPAGTYDIGVDMAFSGTGGAQIECWVYDDGVEATGRYLPRKLGTGGDMGYTGLHSASVTVGEGSVMTFWCQSDGTDTLNVWRGAMRFIRVGS